MSNYTSTYTATYEFDGDTVQVKSKRLKRKDALKLAPYMNVDDDGNVAMNLEKSIEFIDKSADVLKKNVVEFTGLVDADGEPIALGDILSDDGDTYFMPLVSDIIGGLIEHSFLKGDTEKK